MSEQPTYTVINQSSGTVEARGINVVEAARLRLGDDGHRFEVIEQPGFKGWWELRGSERSVNAYGGAGKMNALWTGPAAYGKPIMVQAASEAEAWAKIAPMVIFADWGSTGLYIMTDADYDAEQAALAAAEREAE